MRRQNIELLPQDQGENDMYCSFQDWPGNHLSTKGSKQGDQELEVLFMPTDYSLEEYFESSLVYFYLYYLSKRNWTSIHDHHSLLPYKFIWFILTT